MKECFLIELQGDLEVESGEGLANRFMGDLHFSKDVGHDFIFCKIL